MAPSFVHLRLHTEYSLRDGLLQVDDLVTAAARCRMPALAVTDLHNLFATVKFYKAALQTGVKPLIGADIYLENPREADKPFFITLLCKNNAGYSNLIRLLSRSYTTGTAVPVFQRTWLSENKDGLIVLSGAHEGDTGSALLAGRLQEANEYADFWQMTFPDHYYLEIRRTGKAEDETHLREAVAFARARGIPVVATNDVRFPARDDFEAHEARVCIHAGDILSDPRRKRGYTEEQYFRTADEMAALFSDLPEALENTVEIAKRCTVTLSLDRHFLPEFPVPDGRTPEAYLVARAREGLAARPHRTSLTDEVYEKRLQTELDVIIRMGFAGYFLIVADFTRWSRDNDVPVGPGRGSGPGSLTAYALGITDLDPLEHDLLFERFLNPERVSLPDFDIDFCMAGRDRVIEYVMETHGREAVAQIITYGTMAARAVLRDVGRVLGMPYGFVDRLAKLIPFEIGMTLDKALQQEILLNTRYNEEEEVRTLIDLARRLEGITRNVGRHAGGVVIAPGRLTDYTPLYCEPGDTQHPVTQFDKDDVEAVGLVKFDFLGLRTLTIIDRAIKNIRTHSKDHTHIDIRDLPTDDAATYDLLKSCRTTAVFQLESRGMKDLVKRLQPDCFEDVVALVALFRPGPLQSGMVDDFINRKHGRARVSYPHPALEPILRPTYGVIVYQEQVMQIAQVLAGYSLGAADILRRAMGKKKPEEMAVQREVFCEGAKKNGVSADTATYIFDLMEKFAGYGFNKSHSAAYALIAYQTAWLKTHYPAAFMAAVLSSDMDHTDKVVLFVGECSEIGLTVAPPDVNHSDYAFRVLDEKNLAWGLGAIKGLGEGAIQAITDARKRGPFVSLSDFCARVDGKKINRRGLEALIRAGAMDSIHPNRAHLMQTLDAALQQAEQTLRDRALGQGDLLGGFSAPPTVNTVTIPEWSETERLNGEKETLGLYLSGHPLNRYKHELSRFTAATLAEVYPAAGQTLTVAGIIARLRTVQTRRGDKMAIVSIEDGSGQMDVVCFGEIFKKFRELLVKDALIVVQGEVSRDEFSGGNRIVAADIFPIETARERFATHLRISLPVEKSSLLNELAALLKTFNKGQCPVQIDYIHNNARASLQLGDNWRVLPADGLLERLTEWLGSDCVGMVYKN